MLFYRTFRLQHRQERIDHLLCTVAVDAKRFFHRFHYPYAGVVYNPVEGIFGAKLLSNILGSLVYRVVVRDVQLQHLSSSFESLENSFLSYGEQYRISADNHQVTAKHAYLVCLFRRCVTP